LVGGPGEILSVAAGEPDRVQALLAREARRRFEAAPAPPADLIIAGNHPWPGDPMQSFKVLLHHRAASRRGGVLAGFFWTDAAEIDRSFPLGALRGIAALGRFGGWSIRRLLPLAQRMAAASNSPATFMLHWARELVVDRHVLVFAPPLYDRLGARLGPVHLFADQADLWKTAAKLLDQTRGAAVDAPLRVRVFPSGGLTYAPASEADAQ
jgi:hypothetical protein